MPPGFVVSLVVVVAVAVGVRVFLRAIPLHRIATRLTVTDMVVVGVGVIGLVFHCGAMFFRAATSTVPGAHLPISQISALGTASMIWYAVPAALVLLGLRRQHPVALAALALAFIAVGVTMYDGGTLQVHLTAIFLAVVVLAAVAAGLVLPPWQRAPAATGR